MPLRDLLLSSSNDPEQEDMIYCIDLPQGPYWFKAQRRCVLLKEERAELFYFRDYSSLVEARDARRCAR